MKPRQIFLPAISDKYLLQQQQHQANVTFNNFKFKNTNVNPSLFFQQQQERESRMQTNGGSKVTDLISGLY
jgi:hypothetical protein